MTDPIIEMSTTGWIAKHRKQYQEDGDAGETARGVRLRRLERRDAGRGQTGEGWHAERALRSFGRGLIQVRGRIDPAQFREPANGRGRGIDLAVDAIARRIAQLPGGRGGQPVAGTDRRWACIGQHEGPGTHQAQPFAQQHVLANLNWMGHVW